MNIANYSPYNKSYRFILFQNQAYHEKNKLLSSPCVKTNIKHIQINPQQFSQRRSLSSRQSSYRHRNLSNVNSNNSQLMQNSQNSMIRSSSCTNNLSKTSSSVFFNEQKRIIHKNQNYEKLKMKKINLQNAQIAHRLLRTSCQVIQNKSTQKSFNNHLKYRQIRKKYTDHGIRKSKMCLGNSILLCPTLKQYQSSGKGQKFVQLDLSMSMAQSTVSTKMNKRIIQADFKREIENQACQ